MKKPRVTADRNRTSRLRSDQEEKIAILEGQGFKFQELNRKAWDLFLSKNFKFPDNSQIAIIKK